MGPAGIPAKCEQYARRSIASPALTLGEGLPKKRPSFASRTLALGETLPVIGKLLGHSDIETTARYAHLARDSIQTAAARFTGSIGGNMMPDKILG